MNETPKGFGIACTVAWTELHKAMQEDGMNPPQKCGTKTREWIEDAVRETFASVAQPVEAAITRHDPDYEGSGGRGMRESATGGFVSYEDHIAALAHPRPTVTPEPRDSDLHAAASDAHHEIARAVWEHMNRRSAPGAIMTMAYTAVLHVLSKAAPTGGQAGEVVGEFAPSQMNSVASRLERDVAWAVSMIRSAAQPRPVGVPDGWKVERAPDVLGQPAVRLASPDGEEALFGIFAGERIVRDLLMAAFPLAAAPAPAKAGEA